jgi:hypothetical protein
VSDEGYDLDMAAAALRSSSSDLRAMLSALVVQLDGTFGDRMVVERSGGRFRKTGDVKAVQVTLGDDVLRADVEGSTVRCSIAHLSGGIRIRTDQVDMDAWVTTLLAALEAEAAHSESARQALERVVLGGTA